MTIFALSPTSPKLRKGDIELPFVCFNRISIRLILPSQTPRAQPSLGWGTSRATCTYFCSFVFHVMGIALDNPKIVMCQGGGVSSESHLWLAQQLKPVGGLALKMEPLNLFHSIWHISKLKIVIPNREIQLLRPFQIDSMFLVRWRVCFWPFCKNNKTKNWLVSEKNDDSLRRILSQQCNYRKILNVSNMQQILTTFIHGFQCNFFAII